MAGATVLQGERVTLRTVERDDAEFMQRASTEPELRFPLGFSHPQNVAQIEDGFEDWIESDDNVTLLIYLDDEPIGSVRVNLLEWTRPLLSYWLVPEHHGEGYTTEAVSMFVDFFFETFEKRGLYAFVFGFNDASMGLLEKLGFQEEVRMREDRFMDGEYVDSIHYGLLREEWLNEV